MTRDVVCTKCHSCSAPAQQAHKENSWQFVLTYQQAGSKRRARSTRLERTYVLQAAQHTTDADKVEYKPTASLFHLCLHQQAD